MRLPLPSMKTLRAHFVMLLLAGLLPAVALLIYSVNQATQRSITEVNGSLNTLVHVAAAGTGRLLSNSRELMAKFARRPDIVRMDSQACGPVIAELHELTAGFTRLMTVSREGRIICAMPDQVALAATGVAEVVQRDWFRQLRAGRHFLVDEGQFMLATPVVSEDGGALAGYVVLPLDLSLFAPDMVDIPLANGTRLGMMSADGHLIWQGDDRSLVGTNISQSEMGRGLLATRNGLFKASGPDGVERHFAVSPINAGEWLMFAGVPVSLIYDQAFLDSNHTAFWGALGLTLAILLVIALARRIAEPITSLHDAARALRNGDRLARAREMGPREIVAVAQEFNTLVDAWMSSIDDLRFLAHHDTLTGMPNRIQLAERMVGVLEATAADHRLVAVCFIDVDDFKPINDTHGHHVGDQLLIELSRRLSCALRSTDIAARLGGDEFAIILGGFETAHEIEETLARLQRVLTRPFMPAVTRPGDLYPPDGLTIATSIGVTVYPLDDSAPDLLLRHADHAMYVAKQLGKNRVSFFDAEREASARANHALRDEVRTAIEQHELVLHYQPKVNMRTGEVIGAEALVRWRHPHRGLLMPGEFLPAIEGSDLLIDLGNWVLAEAVRQIDAWRHDGLVTRISVNVSPRQLQQADFVHRLTQLLEAHPRVSPQQLELEVLESAALAEIDSTSRIMAWCKDLGIDFALDDFGTGYSSLAYLKQLPAATLKIDQAFIRDMLEDPDSLAITEGILGLARAFQRSCVAEGVESEAHGAILLHMGCDYGQGYGIARPMSADLLPEWVRSYRISPRWAAAGAAQWNHDDFPLLATEAEHRRWVRQLITCAEEAQPAHLLPAHVEGDHLCNFGRWYRGDGYLHHSHRAEFRALGEAHRRLHIVAAELAEALRQGHHEAAIARIPGLVAVRDEMLVILAKFHDTLLAFPRQSKNAGRRLAARDPHDAEEHVVEFVRCA